MAQEENTVRHALITSPSREIIAIVLSVRQTALNALMYITAHSATLRAISVFFMMGFVLINALLITQNSRQKSMVKRSITATLMQGQLKKSNL